jgi:hypothetical protein
MKPSTETQTRLHYLDWLRVLALLGVFLFHTIRPFDFIDFHINNAELSLPATYFIVFFIPWGMQLFFLISGASTFFALKRRSFRQYSAERIQRLLIPFIVGSIVLTPIQAYFEMVHKGMYLGSFLNFLFDGTLLEFYLSRLRTGFNPRIFGALGYHLWFLGFLLLFSLIAIPIFNWLNGENGGRFIEALVRLVNKRGSVILWVLPLALTQIVLNPIFPQRNDWADFLYQFIFFIYGYLLFLDQRFLKALKKDWVILLFLGVVSTVLILSTISPSVAVPSGSTNSPSASPSLTELVIKWGVFSVNSWVWTVSLLIFGMKYLDFNNNWLAYGRQAILSFFLIHHPIIIAIAFYVVPWSASIIIKFLCVLVGSIMITLGFYEFIIKRISLLRTLLGMK